MKSVRLLELRPTQMAFGMMEVLEKVKDLEKLKPGKFKKEMKDRPLQVVCGPDQRSYLVDGHHRAVAYWLSGKTKAPIEILEKMPRSMNVEKFWHHMLVHHKAHFYDKRGLRIKDPLYVPHDIRGIGDDPYRSLAWLVKCAGGYEDTHIPFADFRWAQFFRRRRILKPGFEIDFEKGLRRALKTAKSPAARKLPGFKAKR